jgi:hypothetical protein
VDYPKNKHAHAENGMCRYCGGEVGDDGYSRMMGEAALAEGSGEVSETIGGNTASQTEPEQYEAAEKSRDAAFLDAIKNRRK